MSWVYAKLVVSPKTLLGRSRKPLEYKIKTTLYNLKKYYPNIEWYLTKTQVMSILKKIKVNGWKIRIPERFDGMFDCVMPYEKEYRDMTEEDRDWVIDKIKDWNYNRLYGFYYDQGKNEFRIFHLSLISILIKPPEGAVNVEVQEDSLIDAVFDKL